MVGNAVRDRLRLLARVKAAGPRLLAGIIAANLVASLMPAATAVVLALLIGRVTDAGSADVLAVAVAPLAVFAVVLLLGHALDAVLEPLYFLASARIDGAHRAEVAQLAATGQLGALERPDVQQLIREAKADPDNWSERTPAAGALAQLGIVGRCFGLVASAALLAGYAWWLVPLVIVPAIAYQQLNRHRAVVGMHSWRRGVGEGLRAEVWWEAIYSPGEGKEIRVFGLGEWAVDRVNRHTSARFEPASRYGNRILATLWQQLLLVLVPLGACYVVVTVAAARGEASVEIATAVLAAGWSIYQLFGGDPNNVVGGIACVRALEQLREAVGDRALRAARGPASDPAQLTSNGAEAAPLVRFDDVRFSYPGGHRTVLDGLDLEIRPGELLAVVGLNGAGKSTLIKLLAGLYRPSSGRITADGVDIEQLPLSRWQNRTAFVFQDFVRYHLSAADNVALGRAGVPRDWAALEAAARDAGLDGVLAELPHGWETPLARSRANGVDLSGGQWQQVVLARALYAVRCGARLLVLDEPTAHLDVRTEFDVFARLAAHKGEASVVLISHRLSTVRQADRIVLLQEGRITESGTHDELMDRGGRYAEMFAIQADRFSRGYDDRIEEGELL